jgi:uncharacterized protein
MGIINIMQKVLPPEEKKFFDYFDEAAEIASQAANLFHDIIFVEYNEERFIEAKNLKHRSSEMAKNTLAELNRTFVTPLDREDIMYLATRLNKITKRVIRGCFDLRIYKIKNYPQIMKQQSETLIKATEELRVGVSLLHKVANLKKVSESNHRMMEIENHGDELLYHAMEELFSGAYDTLEVIKLRNVYRTIESALDNCSNVSESVLNAILKHG